MNKQAQPARAQVKQAAEMARRGQVQEAFDLYGRAVIQSRDPMLLDLAMGWLQDGDLLNMAGEAAVCTLIARLISTIDADAPERRERLRDACLRALRNIDSLTCTPREDTTDRYVTECILLRHMEKPEEALKAAQAGIKAHGTASCATFAGLCCLDLEDIPRAEAYIREGMRLDPGNGSGCNDMADYFFNRSRYHKAAEYYALALQSGDRYDRQWAEPSWLFCRYMLQNSSLDLERLALCAAADLQNDRAAGLCDAARQALRTPYVDFIPPSTEAAINFLRTMRTQHPDMTSACMALSCQETASSIQAIRLEMSRFGKRQQNFKIIVSHIPEPPLDAVLIPEGVRLWEYQDNLDAFPAVSKPTARAVAQVKALAALPFSLAGWYAEAGVLAQGLDAQDAAGLYACMVYPPQPKQDDAKADEWLMRVQYAAVCLLARLGSRFIHAQSEEMRFFAERLPSPELVRICFGQLDWPVIPACTLLAWQAKERLADCAAVSQVLDMLQERVPRHDDCFFEHALVCALEWLPGKSAAFRKEMHARRLQMEES